jgi:3-isopropylmalate/(R)-2-methylmalate dehydratase small subunit
MEPFVKLTAVAVPLDQPNVDTDQIIPARFLGKPRDEQVQGMFHDVRHDASGALRPDFVLNAEAYAGAQILVADENFGCGSSRENAVTVMIDNGFKAFIAPSFGDIFFNNCFQNGVLPIRLPKTRVDTLRRHLAEEPGAKVTVDLQSQTVTGPDGQIDAFQVEGFQRDCLLKGVDEISLTLSHEHEIDEYERQYARELSWIG